MRLLLGSSNRPDAGAGIAAYVKELALEFVRTGIEVHIASPAPKDEQWLSERKLHHFATSEKDNQQELAKRLLDYIRNNRIDAVINNDNSLVQSIAPALWCPFIAVGHFGRTSIASLACHQWRYSDYVVAISDDMQDRYVSDYGVPVTRCPVIHNGIRDIGLLSADVQDNRSKLLRVAFAGGSNRFKGADLVLKSVARGASAWSGIQLAWYGTISAKINREVEHLEYVQVRGHVPRDEFMDDLRRTDVLLFPSREEGCPMALIEAMSVGVIPIVSDGEGAMRWLVTSGINGYVCHLRRWSDEMLECLRGLESKRGMREAMSAQARCQFLENFEISITARRILALLNHPTVDRSSALRKLKILRWHRPSRLSLLDRISFRTGWLRHAGKLETAADA